MIKLFEESVVARHDVVPTSFHPEPEMEKSQYEEYLIVAKDIGIECNGAFLDEKIKQVLLEENISIYDNSKVVKYLDSQLGNDWEWYGLREADKDHLAGWVSHNVEARDVDFSKRVYTGSIPLPVLLTIQKLQKAIPEVYFYISGKKKPDGDPFLTICTRESS